MFRRKVRYGYVGAAGNVWSVRRGMRAGERCKGSSADRSIKLTYETKAGGAMVARISQEIRSGGV